MEKENRKRGTDRGVVVENPLPDAPENITLSKAQFVEKERLRKEKELKIKEFAKTLDKENPKSSIEVSPETPKVEKHRGRPRKIE